MKVASFWGEQRLPLHRTIFNPGFLPSEESFTPTSIRRQEMNGFDFIGHAGPLDRSSSDQVTVRTPIALEFEFWKLAVQQSLSLAVEIFSRRGIEVFAVAENSDL